MEIFRRVRKIDPSFKPTLLDESSAKLHREAPDFGSHIGTPGARRTAAGSRGGPVQSKRMDERLVPTAAVP